MSWTPPGNYQDHCILDGYEPASGVTAEQGRVGVGQSGAEPQPQMVRILLTIRAKCRLTISRRGLADGQFVFDKIPAASTRESDSKNGEASFVVETGAKLPVVADR
jgi:hypothetical protein